MKKSRITFLAAMLGILMLSGCAKNEEKPAPQQTETYVEENTVTVVHHDTENVNFRIAVIPGDMTAGLERLMEDAEKGEAANYYRFYEYDDFSKFKSLFNCGTIAVTTLRLEDALEIYKENPDFICLLAINSEGEDGYGVTVANTAFARKYPFALQVFMEEMAYSAKEATCITGVEMRALIEEALTAKEEALPGDEFYYPLPPLPEDEIVNAEEMEAND